MTKKIFAMCAVLALVLMASQSLLAQDGNRIAGTWDVRVTVTDCQTGALIRTVRSLQMFSQDGSFTETASTYLRGSSLGRWSRTGGLTFDANYWFFRYKPDGTLATIAQALDSITLSPGGDQFTASGTIQDFDANNNLLSTGCFTHAATRLTSVPGEDQ